MEFVNLNGIYRHWKKMHFDEFCKQVFKINKNESDLRNDILTVLDGMNTTITVMLVAQFKMHLVLQLEKDVKEFKIRKAVKE